MTVKPLNEADLPRIDRGFGHVAVLPVIHVNRLREIVDELEKRKTITEHNDDSMTETVLWSDVKELLGYLVKQ